MSPFTARPHSAVYCECHAIIMNVCLENSNRQAFCILQILFPPVSHIEIPEQLVKRTTTFGKFDDATRALEHFKTWFCQTRPTHRYLYIYIFVGKCMRCVCGMWMWWVHAIIEAKSRIIRSVIRHTVRCLMHAVMHDDAFVACHILQNENWAEQLKWGCSSRAVKCI